MAAEEIKLVWEIENFPVRATCSLIENGDKKKLFELLDGRVCMYNERKDAKPN